MKGIVACSWQLLLNMMHLTPANVVNPKVIDKFLIMTLRLILILTLTTLLTMNLRTLISICHQIPSLKSICNSGPHAPVFLQDILQNQAQDLPLPRIPGPTSPLNNGKDFQKNPRKFLVLPTNQDQDPCLQTRASLHAMSNFMSLLIAVLITCTSY